MSKGERKGFGEGRKEKRKGKKINGKGKTLICLVHRQSFYGLLNYHYPKTKYNKISKDD